MVDTAFVKIHLYCRHKKPYTRIYTTAGQASRRIELFKFWIFIKPCVLIFKLLHLNINTFKKNNNARQHRMQTFVLFIVVLGAGTVAIILQRPINCTCSP